MGASVHQQSRVAPPTCCVPKRRDLSDSSRLVRIPAASLIKPSRAACGVSSGSRRSGPHRPPHPHPALRLRTLLAAVMDVSSFPAKRADSSAHFNRILPGWEWLDGHRRLHIDCSPFTSR